MRRLSLILILILMLILMLAAALPASAETYNFANIFMSVDVPNATYLTQLTPDNLADNEAYITSIGETVESMKQKFADEGILLWAYDAEKGRTLIISAVQDDSAKTLFDINQQTADTRASYRANHTNGVFYSKTDYSFESCEWKNFGNDQGRFLMLKYARRMDGKIAYRGLWRRTIRNGYSITLDMRVGARQIQAGDITALNKIQDTISFMQVSTAPDAPLTLGFTAPPPESADTNSFTVKGVTRPGASVIVAYVSMQSGQNKVFTGTADGKGQFSINVTLGSRDLYNVIVSATVSEGLETEETVSQEFSVEYDPNKLPISFTSPFPEAFTTDTFKLTGTTATGVTIQMVVNGTLTTKKTGNNKTFTFTLDTSKEGKYDIQLTFSKKDFDTRIFQYTIMREMDDAQRAQSTRDNSISPEYAKLLRSTSAYEGRIIRYKGYITSVRENGGEYVITFATQKSGTAFKNVVMVLSKEPAEVNTDKAVMLYGTVSGTYSALDDSGKETTYPRVDLAFFDSVSK